MIVRIVAVAAGYLFGTFQSGYLIGRAHGIDIHEHGSGNTGATNVLRVLGVKAGLLVLLLDALKAFIPCMTIRIIFRDDPYQMVYLVYAALGVSLGNNYPFWLGFRGGKGVATMAGWTVAWDPFTFLAGIVVFAIVAFSTRFVSLGSIMASLVLLTGSVIYGYRMYDVPFQNPVFIEFFILVSILTALVILRHQSNIRRLLKGTENRFSKKKNAPSVTEEAQDVNCDSGNQT